jgi:tRNA(Ile2) C34 agmatinyltransferase TiaS
VEGRPTVDKFLSKLIGHQSASLTIRPYETYIEGELKITVAGRLFTFTEQRTSIEHVVAALENAYLCHDWSKADTPLAVIAIHNGTADVVDVDGCQVIIANYDNLPENGCPTCGQDLGGSGRADRLCPQCGFMWEVSDE